MIVRLATSADAAGIATVHVRSWQAAYRGILTDPFLDALSIEQRTERWLGILADDAARGSRTSVAELEGDPLNPAPPRPLPTRCPAWTADSGMVSEKAAEIRPRRG